MMNRRWFWPLVLLGSLFLGFSGAIVWTVGLLSTFGIDESGWSTVVGVKVDSNLYILAAVFAGLAGVVYILAARRR
ncbi:MAG: hypothetical protein H0T39_09325 [Actinobacteria bacterium]|nr:hypothetical protein [Actinomycetota bacterium]